MATSVATMQPTAAFPLPDADTIIDLPSGHWKNALPAMNGWNFPRMPTPVPGHAVYSALAIHGGQDEVGTGVGDPCAPVPLEHAGLRGGFGTASCGSRPPPGSSW